MTAIAIICGILAIGSGAAAYVYYHPQIIIGGIQKMLYRNGKPINSFEPFAPAMRRVYKDVIFDTSPVAGKVYKNSENRRKQGVSCGFRCICRCSICPIRAQPRCP